MLSILGFSLKVMIIGMLVVFVGLLLLILCIYLMSAALSTIEKRKAAPAASLQQN